MRGRAIYRQLLSDGGTCAAAHSWCTPGQNHLAGEEYRVQGVKTQTSETLAPLLIT